MSDSDSDSGSGSETDSSEDVTEDEDGVGLTPALDAAILRTLAKIRNKRGVYEGENVLADELKEAEEKVIKAGIKAMPNRRDEIKVSASAARRLSAAAAASAAAGILADMPRNTRWPIITEQLYSTVKRTTTTIKRRPRRNPSRMFNRSTSSGPRLYRLSRRSPTTRTTQTTRNRVA